MSEGDLWDNLVGEGVLPTGKNNSKYRTELRLIEAADSLEKNLENYDELKAKVDDVTKDLKTLGIAFRKRYGTMLQRIFYPKPKEEPDEIAEGIKERIEEVYGGLYGFTGEFKMALYLFQAYRNERVSELRDKRSEYDDVIKKQERMHVLMKRVRETEKEISKGKENLGCIVDGRIIYNETTGKLETLENVGMNLQGKIDDSVWDQNNILDAIEYLRRTWDQFIYLEDILRGYIGFCKDVLQDIEHLKKDTMAKITGYKILKHPPKEILEKILTNITETRGGAEKIYKKLNNTWETVAGTVSSDESQREKSSEEFKEGIRGVYGVLRKEIEEKEKEGNKYAESFISEKMGGQKAMDVKESFISKIKKKIRRRKK